jgi:hypothetical protein
VSDEQIIDSMRGLVMVVALMGIGSSQHDWGGAGCVVLG